MIKEEQFPSKTRYTRGTYEIRVHEKHLIRDVYYSRCHIYAVNYYVGARTTLSTPTISQNPYLPVFSPVWPINGLNNVLNT